MLMQQTGRRQPIRNHLRHQPDRFDARSSPIHARVWFDSGTFKRRCFGGGYRFTAPFSGIAALRRREGDQRQPAGLCRAGNRGHAAVPTDYSGHF
jgi:hypothetical protein